MPKKSNVGPKKRVRRLPPDPMKKNAELSRYAQAAIEAYQAATKSDREDVISDLLGDLGHFCDRHPKYSSMAECYSRAKIYYLGETDGDGQQFFD